MDGGNSKQFPGNDVTTRKADETSQKLDEMHHVSTYTSTCGGMRRRLALGGGRCGASVYVSDPGLLPRQVAFFEQHVLPGGRDSRVLGLVEDDLWLGRRAERLALVLIRIAGVAGVVAVSGPTRLVAALRVPAETVRARVMFLAIHKPVSQPFFFVFFSRWSWKIEAENTIGCIWITFQ